MATIADKLLQWVTNLTAIIRKANVATGVEDTSINDAVDTLISQRGSIGDTSDATMTGGDLLEGKKGYGASGLLVGEMKNNGAYHQTITENGEVTIPKGFHDGDGSFTVAVPSTGTDTSDANATAGNVEKGFSAYVDGQKVEGTLENGTAEILCTGDNLVEDGNQIKLKYPTAVRRIVEKGKFSMYTPANNFGDAIASDVAVGKTFTSSAGLKVEGTAQPVDEVRLEEIVVKSSETSQQISPSSGYSGFRKVTVDPIALQDKTVSPGASTLTIVADSTYDGLKKVVIDPISLQTKSATPSSQMQTIRPDDGYAGLKSVVVEPITLQTKLIRPTAEAQSIRADSGYNGLECVSVVGDPEFIPSNIKDGVAIFGVIGTYTGSSSGGGTDTSDATATAADVRVFKTFYGKNGKETGTMGGANFNLRVNNETGMIMINVIEGGYLEASGSEAGTMSFAQSSTLVASNIKKGVTIFGVTGTYEGSGGSSGGTTTKTYSSTSDFSEYNGQTEISFVLLGGLTQTQISNITSITIQDKGSVASIDEVAYFNIPKTAITLGETKTVHTVSSDGRSITISLELSSHSYAFTLTAPVPWAISDSTTVTVEYTE